MQAEYSVLRTWRDFEVVYGRRFGRKHRRESCTGKVRHERETVAQVHAIELIQVRVGRTFHPYPCRYCCGWHVGQPRRTSIARDKLSARRTRLRVYVHPDMTLIDAIGERAWACGYFESRGSPVKRENVIARRARAAQRRAERTWVTTSLQT